MGKEYTQEELIILSKERLKTFTENIINHLSQNYYDNTKSNFVITMTREEFESFKEFMEDEL